MPRLTNPATGNLATILDLKTVAQDRYVGSSPDNGWRRVFGGQVVAQALAAAGRSIDDGRIAHSLHAYFLRPGDPALPIAYEVDRLRDGGSFTTRRVVAKQAETPIFAMSASFQREEAGLEFQIPMPAVKPPEACLGDKELEARLAGKLPKGFAEYWDRNWPIEMRLTDESRFLEGPPRAPLLDVWMRAREVLPDDPNLQRAALAFASDYSLIDTALVAHGRVLFDPRLQVASLDHAMWFHRSFRTSDWMLYAQDGPSTSGARGYCRGHIFSRDGRLIASAAQEGLIRVRSS